MQDRQGEVQPGHPRGAGRWWAWAAGPGAALALALLAAAFDLPGPAVATAGLTGLVAAWWVLEPIPIPATSLIPFAFLPLARIVSEKEVATAYGHPLILLLLGGFILSTAMEKSGAHRRVACWLLGLVGGGTERRLVLGFMVTAAALSLWISNTATTLMLLPVALAVLEREREELAPVLLVCLAWAASIGGLGTPIGTPPNVIFLGIYQEMVGPPPTFLGWMRFAIPVVSLLLPLAWWLTARHLRDPAASARMTLPAMSLAERRVLGLFGVTALAWITRVAPGGGWSHWIGGDMVGDATVALAAVVVLFLIPDGKGGRLLDWETARTIPWGLLLLFGGGIALARAFTGSGLADALGHALGGLAGWPVWVLMLTICLAVTFLTEVTSNTATAVLLMPILAAAGIGAGLDPWILMVPATLSASCAFMLPVATAPNAVVYGSGRVAVDQMARWGFRLNLMGALVIATWCWVWQQL